MKIPQQIINDLRGYDTAELEKLINFTKDELNTRKPYEFKQIAFIYESEPND